MQVVRQKLQQDDTARYAKCIEVSKRVRFDIDRLDLSLDGFGAGRALAVPLIEILN